jgi:hypothetical protein
MKKIHLVALILLSVITLSGCGGCPGRSEDSCRNDKSCVNIYKPCNPSETGCKDNKLFTECRTKKLEN